MIAKNPPVRSKEWLKAVHEIENSTTGRIRRSIEQGRRLAA